MGRNLRMVKVLSGIMLFALTAVAPAQAPPMEVDGQQVDVQNQWPTKARVNVSVSETHADEMKAGIELFKAEVRSILKTRCYQCHGETDEMDFTTRGRLLAACLKRNVLTARHFLGSLINAEGHADAAIDLSSNEREQLKAWLELGFPYDRPLDDQPSTDNTRAVTGRDRDFWSLQRFQAIAIPEVQDPNGWCQNEIDRFVLAKLEAAGIQPNPPANRRVLARRAYYDLIGLPPKPSAIESFASREKAITFKQLVNQLLGSTHYGERWAQHWLATVEFHVNEHQADDQSVVEAERSDRYLAYLIWAFNNDQPFDQFLRWQVAGDQFAPGTAEAAHATAFLGTRVLPPQSDAEHIEQARYDLIDEAVSSTSRVFLGLSVGCARCHDHLTDPIPTQDYYRLAAHFRDLALTREEIATDQGRFELYRLMRGDLAQKHSVAEPGYLSVLSHQAEMKAHSSGGSRPDRRSLAKWMTNVDQGAGHLVARVIVNRVWKTHFGRGLVETPDNFGHAGRRPSHPELLDYLAQQLVRNGWRLKPLHRLIMSSATYQQSSRFDRARSRIDRPNELYWRRSPQALEPIVVRDAVLSISGLLEQRIFGDDDAAGGGNQRTVYAAIRESNLVPLLMVFAPPTAASMVRGDEQNEREQQIKRYAAGFAGRLLPKVKRNGRKPDFSKAIRDGYQAAFGRLPTASEMMSAQQLIEQRIKEGQGSVKDRERAAMEEFCRALLNSNEFRYVP